MSEKDKKMKKVQMADFEVVEANLYLDVYPDSQKALSYFYEAAEKAKCAKKEYEESYGPLTSTSNSGRVCS